MTLSNTAFAHALRQRQCARLSRSARSRLEPARSDVRRIGCVLERTRLSPSETSKSRALRSTGLVSSCQARRGYDDAAERDVFGG